jgi:ribosome-binding protein aMBF1 (putative translation factor)
LGKVSDRPRRDRKADLRDGERQTRRGGAGVRQEDPADAAPRARPRAAAGAGGAVKEIRARSLHDKWLRTDPAYRREYQALEGEFALIEAMIQARADARLTQAQLARRMGTTQAVIARLESGRTKPSTRTLERLAKATGMRLRISFEPIGTGKAHDVAC